MSSQDLADKAIDIKGKKYVQVSDRVLYFNEKYTNGCIVTSLLSSPSDEMVVVKATAYPDMSKPERYFTGHSQAKWGDGFINKSSALENAETSAIGRALASMGIGVLDSIASADEINKAIATENRGVANPPKPVNTMQYGKCAICLAPAGKQHATNCKNAN